MSSDGLSVMSIETLQYCSPPPKPPRRRHSEQLGKTGCGTSRKNQSISSFSPSFLVLPEKCPASGSESLPASWLKKHSGKRNVNDVTADTDFQTFNSNIKASFSLPCQKNIITTDFSESKNIAISAQSLSELQSNSDQIRKHLISPKFFLPAETSLNYGFHEPTICHRRHHSDPLVYTNSQLNITSTTNNFKNDSSMRLFKNPDVPMKLNHSVEEAQLMLQEIKSLKTIIDMLWQQLCSVQKELDSVTTNISAKNCFKSPLTFSELICDIYNAQKEKEIVIEKRLQVVEEERNFAMRTIEDILQAAISFENTLKKFNEDETSDKELKKLFHQLETTQNPALLLQQQSQMLTYLFSSKQNKLKQLTEKLNACIKDRVESKEKIDKLQEELIKWKTTRCLLHSDIKQWDSSLLDTLCQIISQRDSALMQIQHLKDQVHFLQTGNSNNSVQMLSMTNSDSRSEAHEKLQASNVAFEVSQGDKKPTWVIKHDGEIDSELFSDELSYLKAKVVELSNSLDMERNHRKIAEENCHKLERVVHLLRRRINGISAGVSV